MKAATMTPECQSFLKRLADTPTSTMSIREELMNNVEFQNKTYNPAIHNDWDTVHILAHHF